MKDRLPGVHDLAPLSFDARPRSAKRLPDLEVLPFDDALRAGDLGAQHGMVDRLVAFAGHDATRDERVDAVAHQQIVFEAHEEARLARIALPSGAAPELKIDAAAFVTIRADHIEAAERRDLFVFRLVRPPRRMSVPRPAMFVEMVTAPSAPARAMISRFHRVVLRVQDLAATPPSRSRAARRSDSSTVSVPDEHGPSGRMGALDLLDDRPLLGVPMGEDDVRVIDADHRAVGRHDDHVEPVQRRAVLRAAVCAVPVMPHSRG